MADTFLFFGLFIFSVCEISGFVKNTPKPISASAGRSFVFSAKNQFSFSNSKSASKETGNTDSGGSQGISSQNGHGSQQQSGWEQIPFNFESQKQEQQQQQQQQQQQTNPTSQLSQQQIQQQQFQHQQGSSMGTSGFQNGQQFGMPGQQANPNTFNQHRNHGQQQPNNFNQMKQGFNQQHFSQQQQSTNMNPGRSQMLHQGSQQQQQQQQQQKLQSFGQQNNVPNGHNTQFRQQGQTHKFNQFNGQPSGNGINVFSQNKPSNMPPFQGINMMTPNQHGFQGNPQQGQLTQYNPQPHGMLNSGQGFNQNSGQQGHMQRHQGPMLEQQHNQMGGHIPGMQRNHMTVPSPHSQMSVQGGGQMPNPQNNNMPRQVGQMPPPTQAGQQGHGPPYKPNLNLAVIDHPMKATTPTTTPKPPTSTVDGEGFVCMTTADCEIGCCFNSTGQLLDTTTYGAGGLREGRASGKCFIRSPGLGDVCDDLCPCQMGHSCYRRYAPNYPKPGEKAPPPIDPESAPKPQRKCLRSAVVEAERSSFWRCYFDVACSGPLP